MSASSSAILLASAAAFYRLRGGVAVVFGRFVMGVRGAFLAPLAGSARLPYGRFLLFDVAADRGGLPDRVGPQAAFLAAGLAVDLVVKLGRRRRPRLAVETLRGTRA